ncbi:hypothetical protein SCUCBS95973_005700 [Sporothrix curviconia]|uniref:Uncharacterized protein n=1 Tax=Sporothrix curviconia TaxID=1260050 RepID=A0ABP0BZF8_9PEZI
MRLSTSSVASSPAFLAGILLLTASSRLPSVSATCYYPNGDTANDVPCNSETDESTCCGTGYACFGVSSQYYLCMATGDELQKAGASTYVRGSCTDETWRSGNCPSVCVDPDRDDVSGGNGVGQCPDSDTEYYCISAGLGVDNCTTDYELIVYASSPTVLTTIGVLPSSTSSSSSSSSTSSSSSSSSSTTTSSEAASGTSSASTTTGSSRQTDAPVKEKSHVGVDVGATLGAVAGAAIIALAAFFFVRRRNKQIAERAAAAAVAVGGASPGGPAGAGSVYQPTPDMSLVPAGYAPAPNYDGYPQASSTSPQPPSELYDPYASNKTASYSGSPPPNQQQIATEMPAHDTRYEMA